MKEHARAPRTGPTGGRLDVARALMHPAWWAALGLLLANDHVLKGAGVLPSIVTGKLSDLAGLFLAPTLMAVLLTARRTRSVLACHVAVGAVFAAINTIPTAAAVWSGAWAVVGIPWRVWLDASDLLALPALALGWIVLHRGASTRTRSMLSPLSYRLALAFGLVACVASSPWPVAPPTVVGQRAMVERQGGPLFVVNTDTGAVLGAFAATGHNDTPPAISDNVFYQVESGNRVTGVNIDNPQTPFTIWQHPNAEESLVILAVDVDRIYIHVRDGERRVFAVDRPFGRQVWSVPVESRAIPQVVVWQDTIMIPDEQKLLGLDARTGKPLWTQNAPDTVGLPSIAGSIAYIASADGSLRGIELGSGRPVWSYQADHEACSTLLPQVAASDGLVFACIDDGTIAIDVESAKIRWTHALPVWAAAESVVVARDGSDTLAGLDAHTGRLLWSRELDDDILTDPIIARGLILARNSGSKLYAVDLKTGALRWQLDLDREAEVRATADGALLVVTRRM